MKYDSTSVHRPRQAPSTIAVWLLFGAIFVAVQFCALFSPPLLDDVDAAHAQAAQHMADTGDLITSKIDGIRYIEKPPLPYWLVAGSYKVFGENTFATHLPNTLAMLGLTWLAWLWARRAWGPRAGLYAGLTVLTSVGPFLFTRFIIPEAELSLFLLVALYALISGLEDDRPNRFYWIYACVALATLTKGLIAPVFFIGASVPYLLLTGQWRRWRVLKPFTGTLLFLAIAAPWHILCGIYNPDQGHPVGNHPTMGNVHGFFYFYFINEHVLRFFNQRYPHDYNKMPGYAYWLTHLVWLFPWSIFLPAAVVAAWRTRKSWMQHLHRDAGQTVDFYLDSAARENVGSYVARLKFKVRTVWLLSLFSAWTLFFFSLSTNQEYYTFPVWIPIMMLIAGVVAGIEERRAPIGAPEGSKPLLSTSWLTGAQATLTVVGVLSAIALGWGLWTSRNLPFVPDIGTVLAHRGVGDYTLSMSHLFDLTGASFAALRLPATLAAIALLIGPAAGWILRLRKRHMAATISVALTFAVFLVAAHIAYARFEPMLSSKKAADTIIAKGSPDDLLIIYGDESTGSSVIFYTHKFLKSPIAPIVTEPCGQHGEGSTLLWGSCYPDAPKVDISENELSKMWGTGNRKWLFAEDPDQAKVESLLKGRLYPAQYIADKALWTDRPLP
ncbi:MAG TPA: glycosyltransferase family 39 protein [Terracidiphilus sp.]|jgi:4-amino-4-deoxy-L-arabinose transferase-like glycosyltransferase|nr:glycosyltransferase family 39 protein [Terracidiphilus sp.]